MKKLVILALLCGTLFGCSSSETANPSKLQTETVNPSELQIRLANVSAFDFKNIKVSNTGSLVNFGNLSSNSKSEYKVFDKAYRYAFVEFQIDGKTYTLQPIDYVGETPLENGKYTYEIDANNSEEQYGKLSLALIKD